MVPSPGLLRNPTSPRKRGEVERTTPIRLEAIVVSYSEAGSASLNLLSGRSALRLRRGGRGYRRRMPGGIGEETEELGIRPQQEAGVVALQPGLIGRHRAVEREEL